MKGPKKCICTTFIAVLIFTCRIIKYRQETSCTLLLLLLLLAINTTRIAINVKTANGRVDICLHIKREFDLHNNKWLKTAKQRRNYLLLWVYLIAGVTFSNKSISIYASFRGLSLGQEYYVSQINIFIKAGRDTIPFSYQ